MVIMAKKKATRTRVSRSITKKAKQTKLQKIANRVKKNIPLSLFALFLVWGLGFTAYNLYLDKQNRVQMKSLVVELEQLEIILESKTGDQFFIEASCDSVGGEKFSTSYTCSLALKNLDTSWTQEYSNIIANESALSIVTNSCMMLSLNSAGFESNKDHLVCLLKVRPLNETAAEKIFFQYDDTPGRAF